MTAPTSAPRRARAATPLSRAAPLLLLAACVTQPPSHAERAEFGDVAVETVATPHEVDWDRPVTGWAAGLGMGAARGFGALVAFPVMALSASNGGGGDAGLLGLAIIVVAEAAAILWFPFSVLGGIVTAPASESMDAADAVLRPILEDAGLRDAFAARCAESVRAKIGRDLVEPSQATTVVEARLVSISRGSAWNWWTFDRPFDVVVEASVRVVRRADGHVVWEETRKSAAARGKETRVLHTYAEWAADGGAALRAEIDVALRELASGFAFTILQADRVDWLGHKVGEADERASPAERAAPAAGERR